MGRHLQTSFSPLIWQCHYCSNTSDFWLCARFNNFTLECHHLKFSFLISSVVLIHPLQKGKHCCCANNCAWKGVLDLAGPRRWQPSPASLEMLALTAPGLVLALLPTSTHDGLTESQIQSCAITCHFKTSCLYTIMSKLLGFRSLSISYFNKVINLFK